MLPQNVCYQGVECEKEDCGFHHPNWIKDKCPYYLRGKDNCDLGQQCSKQHYSWEMIRKIATEENTLDYFSEKSFDPTKVMGIATKAKKDNSKNYSNNVTRSSIPSESKS